MALFFGNQESILRNNFIRIVIPLAKGTAHICTHIYIDEIETGFKKTLPTDRDLGTHRSPGKIAEKILP